MAAFGWTSVNRAHVISKEPRQGRLRNPGKSRFLVRAAHVLEMTIALLFSCSMLFACPMCTDLIEHGADAMKSWRFGLGIGWSILVMLGILFSMIGAFVFAIWRGQKKSAHSSPKEVSGGIRN